MTNFIVSFITTVIIAVVLQYLFQMTTAWEHQSLWICLGLCWAFCFGVSSVLSLP